MEMFLDVQSFIGPNDEPLPKELAVVNMDGTGLKHALFTPPYDANSQSSQQYAFNDWLTNNCHGIPWNAGVESYKTLNEIVKQMTRNAWYVLVKGEENKDWLTGILHGTPRVLDMEDMYRTLPPLENLKYTEVAPWHDSAHKYIPKDNIRKYTIEETIWYDDSSAHIPKYDCALENVQRLKSWYWKECIGSPEKSLRLYKELDGLRAMEPNDIAFLSKEFIYTYPSNSIDVWYEPSENMKMDESTASCRRCTQHYTLDSDDDDDDIADGPNPLVKDCLKCNSLPKKM